MIEHQHRYQSKFILLLLYYNDDHDLKYQGFALKNKILVKKTIMNLWIRFTWGRKF